jgi:tetratricopeptide (TPR) repeat protein
MNTGSSEFTRGLIVMVFLALLVGAGIVLSIRKSEEPRAMAVRWVLTGVVVWFLFGVAGEMVGQGGYNAAFVGLPLTAACGLVLAIIWRHSIAALFAKPFTSLYDGGSEPPEARPLYSVGRARQKQGRYLEAVAEIRQQLERFPTDVEGQLLLAQIQAEDLRDLPAAESTIDRFCAQPGHAPKNLAFALYSMADWHLAVGHDPEAACRQLQRIIDLLPESEFSVGAAQRIAHMAGSGELVEPHEHRKYVVAPSEEHVGLLRSTEHLKPVDKDPREIAGEYVRHLEKHPLDTEAREKLAVVYVDQFQRLDLAADQLEQMIADTRQPARFVVRWLNLLADLQVRSGAGYEQVAATLQRVIDRDPKLAAAELARQRLARLRLELKANEKSQAVKLGSYEQNIGLKRGLPHNKT